MIVFFDTNVVLDVFTHRQPFYHDSARCQALAEQRRVQGLVSAVGMTTLYYVVRRYRSRVEAARMLDAVRACVGFAPCDTTIINQAIDAGFSDFEDAVQYFSAKAARADALVTRNTAHFPSDDLSVLTPKALLSQHALG